MNTYHQMQHLDPQSAAMLMITASMVTIEHCARDLCRERDMGSDEFHNVMLGIANQIVADAKHDPHEKLMEAIDGFAETILEGLRERRRKRNNRS